jgi:arylsulfatase A-like enzyme
MRPNVIVITSDQQRGDCFGFEGRKVKTPHLDIMAMQGTRFSACITPSVVCQPARASILTGLLPQTHGVWDNGVDLDDEVGRESFAGQLGRAGYKTAFIGKAHFSTMHTFEPTGRPENAKSSNLYQDWYGPYMGFEYVELVAMGHNRNPPQKPPFGMHYDRWFYSDGLGDLKWDLYQTRTGPDADATQTIQSGLPPAWHNSTWTADRAIEYLRNAKDEKDAPFAMWISFPDPHHPFDAPEPWSRMHAPEDVDLPDNRTKDLERRPWWHKAALDGKPKLDDPDMLKHRTKNSRVEDQTDEQLRHIIANYYGMISLIDHNVGRIMIALNDMGLDENTIVIYTSDHGDWLGDHGLLLKGPMPYEGLLRVGLIVKGPGVPQGKIVDEPVSTLDIAPTFLDYGEVKSSIPLHGQSLRPLIEDGATREFALSEWKLHPSRTGISLDLRIVRTKTAKLTLDLATNEGEMYDLVRDPLEMDNVFHDPAYAELRARLTEMIHTRPQDFRELKEPVGIA